VFGLTAAAIGGCFLLAGLLGAHYARRGNRGRQGLALLAFAIAAGLAWFVAFLVALGTRS